MSFDIHSHTPVLSVIDSRGLPIRQVAYLRKATSDTLQTLIDRQHHDLAGRLIEQWDPRLFGTAPKANLTTIYKLSGQPLLVDSVDAGWRLSLPGLAGQPLQRWDQRGSHWQTDYDRRLRVVALHEHPSGQPQTTVERFTYADGAADASHNLRGQMIHRQDPSGTVTVDSFSLQGQHLRETRTFLDAKAYTTAWYYSASGQQLTQVDAAGHRQYSRFDVAGQLKDIRLQLYNALVARPILTDMRYNAAGQIESQTAGNGVVSTWTYDRADGRLCTFKAHKPGDPIRQDMSYFHDCVGNIRRIEDHTLTTVFFANQRVDGHREFTYDSLYRLTSASGFEGDSPNLQPGLPPLMDPIDPLRRFNYSQAYDYDEGGNLTQLRHIRAGNNHTLQMRIEPHGNRGLRWAVNDPEPIFDSAFDAHGNLQSLRPGQPLVWNHRDQLAIACLVERDNAPNDEEIYTYSQGVRVSKHLVTQAKSVTHKREVRYLHGLEIRTLDDDEELQVITLPGNVRCLHWVKGIPSGINNDQLRYSLDDHLSSSTLELDELGALISLEFYYPFGGTAWWAARSAVEADYKTVRYSGKQMDVSGLYCYGLRYYAPWLQRWISADPQGDVDGLNLYAMVGNNPLLYVDGNGGSKEKHDIYNYALFISSLASNANTTKKQIEDILARSNISKSLLKNMFGESLNATAAFFGGFYGSELLGGLLPGADIKLDSFTVGFFGGNAGGDLAADSEIRFHSPKLVRPLIPQTSTMSIAEIDRQAGIDNSSDANSALEQGMRVFIGRFIGSVVPGVSVVLALGSRVQEAEDIKSGLSPMKIDKIQTMLSQWQTTIEQRWAAAQANFKKLGADVIYPADLLPNVNNLMPKSMLAPIHRGRLEQQTKVTLAIINRTQYFVDAYKKSRTTDNQFMERQRKPPK
ncbi:RHS repeat domain-containing protein [Pseudomonas sp. PICF141]|uniref:RHS repeat domain-containing protein n=1 Tax=Pseudomonas sp. PICF141 TaxID=1949067 RepID=UPI000BAB5448|nr:RHS repeat-associated core domain-containing protein [Pseudomonas sp. PICF141]PAU59359.1 toxin [Pseudomonas sp. PICF141]